MASGMSSTERRAAPRAVEQIPLAITESGVVLSAQTKNLSASGAYCTLERYVAPMTKVQLQFELPDKSRRVKICCAGVVVRIDPLVVNAERSLYQLAIFFTDLADRDRSVIVRFVQHRLAVAPSTN